MKLICWYKIRSEMQTNQYSQPCWHWTSPWVGTCQIKYSTLMHHACSLSNQHPLNSSQIVRRSKDLCELQAGRLVTSDLLLTVRIVTTLSQTPTPPYKHTSNCFHCYFPHLVWFPVVSTREWTCVSREKKDEEIKACQPDTSPLLVAVRI